MEEEEFKGANGRDSQREHGRNDNHAPISFFFFLNQKQLIQCNLPHSHTYLKCPRMNTAVIKSHSADEMKTVRRQRRKRGGGGGARNGLGKPHFHHRAPLTTQITFHFHSCSVAQLSLPAGRFSTRSWIVSQRRNPRKGEEPGRREAQPGRIKNLP